MEESSEEPTLSKSNRLYSSSDHHSEEHKENEELSKGSDSSHKSGLSTSTVLASPIKGVSPDICKSPPQLITRVIQQPDPISLEPEIESSHTVSEVIEEALESLVSNLESQSLSVAPQEGILEGLQPAKELDQQATHEKKLDGISPKQQHEENEYSESFEITSKEEEENTSNPESELKDPDAVLKSSEEELSQTLTPSEKDKPAEETAKETIPAALEGRLLEDQVDKITNQLWKELCKDTGAEVSPLVKHLSPMPPVAVASEQRVTESDDLPTLASLMSSRNRSPISPRSKPQDLMLTTFDISPTSSASSSPKDNKSDNEFDNDPAIVNDDDFMDDDFGLSAIRKEAEALRLQQERVEEEIARIQSQKDLAAVRSIPDKPPPPYVPPEPVVPVKPVRPPPPQRTFIPQVRVYI